MLFEPDFFPLGLDPSLSITYVSDPILKLKTTTHLVGMRFMISSYRLRDYTYQTSNRVEYQVWRIYHNDWGAKIPIILIGFIFGEINGIIVTIR